MPNTSPPMANARSHQLLKFSWFFQSMMCRLQKKSYSRHVPVRTAVIRPVSADTKTLVSSGSAKAMRHAGIAARYSGLSFVTVVAVERGLLSDFQAARAILVASAASTRGSATPVSASNSLTPLAVVNSATGRPSSIRHVIASTGAPARANIRCGATNGIPAGIGITLSRSTRCSPRTSSMGRKLMITPLANQISNCAPIMSASHL